MNLQDAINRGLPLKWNTWPGWYTWNVHLGTFEPVDESNPRILTLPTHVAVGTKWEVQENAEIEWFQPFLWHRKGRYYKESRNWYPSKTAATDAYATDYSVVSWKTQILPRSHEE